jgi:hypothetical protein
MVAVSFSCTLTSVQQREDLPDEFSSEGGLALFAAGADFRCSSPSASGAHLLSLVHRHFFCTRSEDSVAAVPGCIMLSQLAAK